MGCKVPTPYAFKRNLMHQQLNLRMIQILFSFAFPFFIAAVLESSRPIETEYEKLSGFFRLVIKILK